MILRDARLRRVRAPNVAKAVERAISLSHGREGPRQPSPTALSTATLIRCRALIASGRQNDHRRPGRQSSRGPFLQRPVSCEARFLQMSAVHAAYAPQCRSRVRPGPFVSQQGPGFQFTSRADIAMRRPGRLGTKKRPSRPARARGRGTSPRVGIVRARLQAATVRNPHRVPVYLTRAQADAEKGRRGSRETGENAVRAAKQVTPRTVGRSGGRMQL
jgi:hypothetical protein